MQNPFAVFAIMMSAFGGLLCLSAFFVKNMDGRRYAWPYLLAPSGLTLQLFAGPMLAFGLMT